MPSTRPLKSPVARNERTYGIRMENTSALPSGVPIVRMENEAGCCVSQSASAAAIFIGCCSVMILPWMSPVTATSRPETSTMIVPALAVVRNGEAPSERSRSSFHIEMPAMNAPVVMNAAGIVWTKVIRAVLLVRTARKSSISARPVAGLTV